MFRTSTVVVAFSCMTLALAGCGDDAGPTGESASPRPEIVLGGTRLAGSGPQSQAVDGPTVAEILANPGAFFGQSLRLTGRVTQPLGPMSFLFDDGTASLPADFPDGPLPALEATLHIDGTVTAGSGDFAARISVRTWETPAGFSCDDIIEVRARFSDPGFVSGNVVGYFLSYAGVPAGVKTLEIRWDDGEPAGSVDRFELGEGRLREDGRYDLEGVVGHEYAGVAGTETKQVRATLMLEERDGGCSRVRDVTVDKGTGPGFAAGGALRLSFDDPVQSGGSFAVTALVSNPTSSTADARLVFQAPDGSSVRKVGPGCTQLDAKKAECLVPGIGGGGTGDAYVQYALPVVSEPTVISGSVSLVARDFSPVASFSTTVVP